MQTKYIISNNLFIFLINLIINVLYLINKYIDISKIFIKDIFKFILNKVTIFIKKIFILILDKVNIIFVKNSYKVNIFKNIFEYFLGLK